MVQEQRITKRKDTSRKQEHHLSCRADLPTCQLLPGWSIRKLRKHPSSKTCDFNGMPSRLNCPNQKGHERRCTRTFVQDLVFLVLKIPDLVENGGKQSPCKPQTPQNLVCTCWEVEWHLSPNLVIIQGGLLRLESETCKGKPQHMPAPGGTLVRDG